MVTICIDDRRHVLGVVVNGVMRLSPAGKMVLVAWRALEADFPGVVVDAHVVMPNHLHGIVWLPLRVAVGDSAGFDLGDVIRRFKTVTQAAYAAGVRDHGWHRPIRRLWQRSFHDRVLRGERALEAARVYILANPENWLKDPLR